ncbi:LacI family DNA-binding transcriptional regulator [Rhizobium sp. SAFR-030]|uniref:LacI family DNA-binding transcriptional regulator n=1 Tax=Rhizobium sp. SAFR-030 TaxID=3387277 RepID=UPI003F80A901
MTPEKPKLARIAETLGVSIASVSNALSGKGRVSPELAQRIRTLADELGYVPSVAGRALRTGRSGVLGLVLPDIANPLFPQIAQAIERAASTKGYGVLIGDSRGETEAQADAIARLTERGVDGLVVIPRRGTSVTGVNCPVAVIDSPSTPGNTVAADHLDGGRQMGAHLAALGHRQVVILAGSPLSNVQADRVAGLKQGLGAQAVVDVVWLDGLDTRSESGTSLGLGAWVAEGTTAFAALSDLIALRALTELQGAGITVPDQVTVTGFDDLIWSSVVTPPLTTMRMDMVQIATIAIGSLTQAIAETSRTVTSAFGTIVSEQPNVPMTLVVRQSCGPVPTRRQTTSTGGR